MFGQSGLNFGTIFSQFRLKFQDYSRTSRTKFSEMFREFLDSMESSLSQKFAKKDSFYGAFNVWGQFVNLTSYYRCPYRMGLACKVLLESKFVRDSRFEIPMYVLWLKR